MTIELMDDVVKHVAYDMEGFLAESMPQARVSITDRDDRRRRATVKVLLPSRTAEAEMSVHKAYARVAREYCGSAFLDIEIDEQTRFSRLASARR